MKKHDVPRVALYARVSTTGQGQDPALQIEELKQIAAQRGWQIAGEFVDAGVSGMRESRPALDRLLAACHAGQVDVVAVWKLDRLGRSLQHLVNTLADLSSCSVGFVSVRDAAIDTTTPSGRLMLALIGAFAEFEHSLIAERVRAGVARALAAGVQFGRKRRALDLRAAHALLDQGQSEREVAVWLGVPRSTLKRRLAEARAAGGPEVPEVGAAATG
jgi:DNA invertase Pin-like site-specific DNA recombinase